MSDVTLPMAICLDNRRRAVILTLIRILKAGTFALFAAGMATPAVWAGGTPIDGSTDNLTNEQQAKALIQQFAGQLKPKLKQAMEQGGPVYAIDICATAAPEIAARLSTQAGWRISRVSTGNRNPNATPDEWEAGVIKTFESRLAQGADPASLEQGETTPSGYRFAKAQLAEPLCLTCHGQTIAPEIQKALEVHYPEDQAIGYEAGDIRGIFSVINAQ
jgi:hypothetical protein